MKYLPAGSVSVFCGALLAVSTAAEAQNYSEWVAPGPDGKLEYKVRDSVNVGDRLPDFSMVGYGAGLRDIPDVPTVITLNPIAGDNTQHIQNAINQLAAMPILANGFRGAIELGPGQFNVNGTININASGIVLRGAGSGGNLATSTRIVSQNRSLLSTNRVPVIDFMGSATGRTKGPVIQITDARVPVGAQSFNVASTANLSVGQVIEVSRPSTAAWFAELGMDQMPDGKAWTPDSSRDLVWQRTITRIEGDKIYIDAPVTTAIETEWGNGGTVRSYNLPNQLHNVGVENLRIQSLDNREVNNESRTATAVRFDRVADGFMRNVETWHFPLAAVAIAKTDGTQHITVDQVASRLPSGPVTGGRRYTFLVGGQMSLVQNSQAEQGRHDFVTEAVSKGPIVFFNSTTSNSLNDTGPHHTWSSGLLFDNITVNGNSINIQNRWDSGNGHGWAGANSIVWNSQANSFIVQSPPTAQNWLIGSKGQILPGNTHGIPSETLHESSGTNGQRVSLGDPDNNPLDSLYIAQLLERRQYYVDQLFWTGSAGSNQWFSQSGDGWSNWTNNRQYNTNMPGPHALTDVVFNLQTSGASVTTRPGQSVHIASLQFDSPSRPVVVQIDNDDEQLTIGQRGVTSFYGSHRIDGAAGDANAAADLFLDGDVHTWEIRADSTVTVNAKIGHHADGGVWNKLGTGNVVLNARSDQFNRQVLVGEGVMRLNHTHALGDAQHASHIAVNDGAVLQLGFSTGATFANLQGDILLAGTGIGTSGALRSIGGDTTIGGDARIQLFTQATGINSGGNTLRIHRDVTGDGGLEKRGPGTLILAGDNDYRGPTDVRAGTLHLDNVNHLGGGQYTIRNNTTLSGTGHIDAAVLLATGSTLAPGQSVGALHTASQTWNRGATYLWQINDADGQAGDSLGGWDVIHIDGSLTLNATASNPITLVLQTLDGTTPGPMQNFAGAFHRWTILTADEILGFNADAFVLNTAGFAADFNTENLILQQEQGELQLVHIPEPAGVVLLAVGAGGLLTRRSLRREKAPSFFL